MCKPVRVIYQLLKSQSLAAQGTAVSGKIRVAFNLGNTPLFDMD
jgi:hypothetical protein